MEEAWRRIVEWYAANAPTGSLRLPAGASDSAIRSAERRIGFTLPPDLRAFYRLHDGLGEPGFLHYGSFQSLTQMVASWQAHLNFEQSQRARIASGEWAPTHMTGPIRSVWWSAKRALITNIGGTDGVMVDVDPAPGGAVGQLVEFDHELGPRCVLAPSFTNWLQRLAVGLEAGLFERDADGPEIAPCGYYERRESLNDWERRLAEAGTAADGGA